MVVVEEFTSQFEVEFAIELGDTFADVLRLDDTILLVVKTYFHCLKNFGAKLQKRIAVALREIGFLREFQEKATVIAYCFSVHHS